MANLDILYRPDDFSTVIGQSLVVKSLQNILDSGNIPHSFIFNGISGTGKTTLARIIAAKLGCESPIEIDAATYTGIDAMREVTENLKYSSITGNNKIVIIDEIQALSKAAFQSLLKTIEEPPSHVFFIFCTTEISKIPEAIKTRCHVYNLKPVPTKEILELISFVNDEEKLEIAPNILEFIAEKAEGSPRKALVMLSQCRGITSIKEVEKILEGISDSPEVIDLCRKIINKDNTLQQLQTTLKSIKDLNPESVRIQILNYFQACFLNAKKEEDAVYFLSVMEAFSNPIMTQTGFSEIVLNTCSVLFK